MGAALKAVGNPTLADCFEGSRQQLQARFAEAIDATQLMNSNPN
jgi:spore coat polysaccharide biosynthesis protein SpsF (cytidylyltransferase family)